MIGGKKDGGKVGGRAVAGDFKILCRLAVEKASGEG